MFCHLLRHNLFVTNIFEGRIYGHRGRSRPRKAYYIEKMIRQADYTEYVDMKRPDFKRKGKAFNREVEYKIHIKHAYSIHILSLYIM